MNARTIRRDNPEVAVIDRELRSLEAAFDRTHDKQSLRGLIKRQMVLMEARAKYLKGGPDAGERDPWKTP